MLLAPASVNKRNMHNAVTDFLRTSHACLLLVHPEVRTLEDEANELLSVYEWPRRLLVAARAAVYGALVPAPTDKRAAKETADFGRSVPIPRPS